ncbi:hypothetical protein ACFORG_04705 [Lutimaribacter marinistellae]|uniref:Sulfotransferase family protein n=1 Tax=Lutimaribacter marinistellae TaxID=1820329 RepID=A0ABV7TE41_9RHOB
MLAGRGLRYERWSRTTKWDGSQVELPVAALAACDAVIPFRKTRSVFGLPDLAAARELSRTWLDWLDSARKEWAERMVAFSSEHLLVWLTTVSQVRAMHRILSERFQSVRYVAWLRPQEDWLLSQYSQGLRSGSTQTLDEMLNTRLQSAQSALPNFAARLRLWVEALGADALRVFRLDGARNGRDHCGTFCELAGIAGDDLGRPETRNASFGAHSAEAMRQINLRLPYWAKGQNGINPARQGIAPQLEQTAGDEPPLALTDAQRKLIATAYEPGNRWLAETFADCAGLTAKGRTRPAPASPTTQDTAARLIDLLFASRMGALAPLTETQRARANPPHGPRTGRTVPGPQGPITDPTP